MGGNTEDGREERKRGGRWTVGRAPVYIYIYIYIYHLALVTDFLHHVGGV
jgi:hypothetical protein